MKSVRTLVLLLVALFVAGCAHDEQAYAESYRAEATTAKKDCSPHQWSHGLRAYTMLVVDAKLADRDFMSFSGLATLGPAEALDKAEKEARARADEVIRKLDALDRKADTWRASDGECFGEGDYGEQIADKYLRVKEVIAEQRKEIEEGLEKVLTRYRAAEAERIHFDRWRVKNRELLVRHVGGMKLEIAKIAISRLGPETVLTVEATNTTASRILKPRNQKVWGYQFGSNIGGLVPVGASLTDSFGNNYKLTSISPPFLGDEAKGIKPGQTVTFEVRFGDIPLKNAKSMRLVIEPATFGQQARTMFEIPSEAFYRPVAKR